MVDMTPLALSGLPWWLVSHPRWTVPFGKEDYSGGDDGRALATNEEANAISSHISPDSEYHRPMLDVDRRVLVLPSSTDGHHHIYIDVVMPWWRYRRLLRALARAGIIEKGYYSASVARRGTFLRLPGITKEFETPAATP